MTRRHLARLTVLPVVLTLGSGESVLRAQDSTRAVPVSSEGQRTAWLGLSYNSSWGAGCGLRLGAFGISVGMPRFDYRKRIPEHAPGSPNDSNDVVS